MPEETIELEFISIQAETNQAILFEFPEGRCWVPISQITDRSEDVVTIPEWYAIEKGLV